MGGVSVPAVDVGAPAGVCGVSGKAAGRVICLRHSLRQAVSGQKRTYCSTVQIRAMAKTTPLLFSATLAFVTTFGLGGCDNSPPSSLRFSNATAHELLVTSISINGKPVSSVPIEVPALSTQHSSNQGRAPGVSLRDKDKLTVAIQFPDRSTRSYSCDLPARPGDVCLVKARYSEADVFTCVFDCASINSR